MGEEIQKSRFSEDEFLKFSEKLREETELVREWFEEDQFEFKGPLAGFELETWLVDKNLIPNPINDPFLESVNSPALVHELAKFNVEINSFPHSLRGNIFSKLQTELEWLWKHCNKAAGQLNSEMVMIGTLPTLDQEMLSLENMSSSERYHALNEQIFRQRNGAPLALDINGKDNLKITHDNVMLESSATSLQIHVNIPHKRAVQFYNAAHLISVPMVGLTANSPFLFWKRLWDETRIPVFEQAVSLNEFPDRDNYPVRRVTFGSGFLKKSFFEPFQENLEKFPPLLPILFEEPKSHLRHFRLHNGTIWRWNRPVIGESKDGSHHLRLEHRVASAGPSILDVVANIAFFIGLLYGFGTQEDPIEKKISFSQAREQFYRVAKDGLKAQVTWFGGKKVKLQDLILSELIPLSKEGLRNLLIDEEDIRYFIDEIIRRRVKSGQNGAAWQRSFLEKCKGDFHALTEGYVDHQRSGRPVHEWSL